MTSNKITLATCMWQHEDPEKAARLYQAVFPDYREVARGTWPANNPMGAPVGAVMLIEFVVGAHRVMLLHGGPQYTPNPSVSLCVQVSSKSEVQRIYNALLADGGSAEMPLDDKHEFGWVQDRFHTSWQVMLGSDLAPGAIKLAPTLMFTGAQYGHGEEAVEAYMAALPGSRVIELKHEPHTSNSERRVLGWMSRIELAGQEVLLVECPKHTAEFSEGASLMTRCDSQASVDHVWNALTANGGQAGPCGWLKDRFGLSWQVVPVQLDELMNGSDGNRVKQEAAFDAMMKQSKLNVQEVQDSVDAAVV